MVYSLKCNAHMCLRPCLEEFTQGQALREVQIYLPLDLTELPYAVLSIAKLLNSVTCPLLLTTLVLNCVYLDVLLSQFCLHVLILIMCVM